MAIDQDRPNIPEVAVSASAVILAIVVRFMKSRTERPEEKRAERAVGSTWFGPPM